ncbi:hypothetical protein TIFTF001_015235 [Ficus carica]|uniref:Uncharacterized protein n=1 Tax=Ficus carica TaxID=3494 RepID=A0AA88AHE8_FICCA|nr:hypothetical protein TIFTF001_015235 [Ficus carica]
MFDENQVSTCGKCGGDGKIITDYCRKCGGGGQVQSKRTMNIVIPAGVNDGATMRIQGDGNFDNKSLVMLVCNGENFLSKETENSLGRVMGEVERFHLFDLCEAWQEARVIRPVQIKNAEARLERILVVQIECLEVGKEGGGGGGMGFGIGLVFVAGG